MLPTQVHTTVTKLMKIYQEFKLIRSNEICMDDVSIPNMDAFHFYSKIQYDR